MKIFRILTVIVLSLSMSACFQTILGGPTGDSTVSVSPLREPGNILAQTRTRVEADWIAELGQEPWDEGNPILKLLFLGTNPVDTDNLDPAALYLVTASGGIDYDPNVNGAISDSPVPVQGSWHVIATGQRIIDGNIEVSALTEALYRQVVGRLDALSDAQVLEQLDAASRLVVSDVIDSEAIDYEDALRWIRTVHADAFLGELAAVDELATAIRAGQPADILETLSARVLGEHRVVMQTNFGAISMDTLNWEAPVTVDNFLRYVEEGFYDNIIFHRVINGFVIQAGLWELLPGNQVRPKDPRNPIRNESRYSVSNARGTLSMARTSNPDSASSQFFINQAGNPSLDFGSSDGYTVFARVISGLDVVDEIAALPTIVSGIGNDVPFPNIPVIESTTIEQ